MIYKGPTIPIKRNNNNGIDLENIEIGVLSFNLEDLNDYKDKEYLKKNLNDDFSKIIDRKNIDLTNKNKIWFVSTQEDVENSLFCNILTEYFNKTHNISGVTTNSSVAGGGDGIKKSKDFEDYKKTSKTSNLLIHEFIGLDIKIKKSAYFIHSMIFIPQELAQYIADISIKKITHLYTKNILKLGKYLLQTKNSLICIIKFIDPDNSFQNLFFINSHLPINTKSSKSSKSNKSNTSKFSKFTKFFSKSSNKSKKLQRSISTRSSSSNNSINSNNSSSYNNSNNSSSSNNSRNTSIPSNSNNSDSIISNLSMETQLSNNSGHKSLGYELRVEAINEVLNFIGQYMVKQKLESIKGNHIIWTGDLNFRMDKENNKTTNQISTYINELGAEQYIQLEDLSQIDKYGPTCKTFVKTKILPKCKKEYLGKETPSLGCYDIESKHGKRIPSYCDRILGWSSGNVKVISTNVEPLVDTFMTTLSDHNPILGTLKFVNKNESYAGGGNRYKSKSNYKTKKNNKINKINKIHLNHRKKRNTNKN